MKWAPADRTFPCSPRAAPVANPLRAFAGNAAFTTGPSRAARADRLSPGMSPDRLGSVAMDKTYEPEDAQWEYAKP